LGSVKVAVIVYEPAGSVVAVVEQEAVPELTVTAAHTDGSATETPDDVAVKATVAPVDSA
jgi:hypothetical protein